MNDPRVASAASRRDESRAHGPDGVKERAKRLAHAAINPLVTVIVRLGIGANLLTFIGLLVSVCAGVAFFEGQFRIGSLVTALAGLFDLLDGQVARRSGKVTRFGAFFDSTLDRLADAAVLCGLAGFYMVHLLDLVLDPAMAVEEIGRGLEPRTWVAVALTAMLALVGSFMVSYTRARAEGLGVECRVGWFERPERMLLIIVAGLFGVGSVMSLALLLLAVLSFVTVIQRVAHVRRVTRAG